MGSTATGSVAKIDLGGQNLVVAGGLLVNNGGAGFETDGILNGTVVVDYGGRAKGAGYYHDVVTQNGGVFSPGNSPGSTPVGTARVAPGGILDIAIDSADGTAGAAPGWGLVKAVSGLRLYATPTHPQIITLTTELPGDTDTPGPMADFDPTEPERWEVVRMLPGALLYGSLSGGAPINPSTFMFDPAAVVVQTAGAFRNPILGGTFATTFGPNDGGTYSLFVTFTPTAVPEPGTLAFFGFAAAVGWRRLRRTSRKVRYAARIDGIIDLE